MAEDEIKKLKDEIDRLEKTFADEIERKNNMIDELREQNSAMFKAAVKSSEKIEDLTKKLEEALKKI